MDLSASALSTIMAAATPAAPLPASPWYSDAGWQLVGAVLTIVVSHAIAVALVYLQSTQALKLSANERKIERLAAQLGELYNPIYSLLRINAALFHNVGPPSFPSDDETSSDAARGSWQLVKVRILQNNRQIEDIIRGKSHLLNAGDQIENYEAILVHIAMYETFSDLPTEWYSQFRFPSSIVGHVAGERLIVLKSYREATGGIDRDSLLAQKSTEGA